jgi:rRNA maturation protein Nop10
MQIVNKTRKCTSCGCVALLDSKICPKCGKYFSKNNPTNMDDDFYQMSQLIKLLQFSNGVNIRFSFVNKSQVDIDLFRTCV